MKRWTMVMSLVAGLLLLGIVADYSRANVPDIPGKIVYTQGKDLWVAHANGDNPQRLTATGGWSSPSWSPDGTRIAYILYGGKSSGNIWIIKADGNNPQQLTTTKDCVDLSWSPDGTKIAYIRCPEKMGPLYSWCYDLTTRSAARLVPDRDCWETQWSPDSRWIAFSIFLGFEGGGESVERLEISSPSGQNRKTIVKKGYNLSFIWSPDGKRIYYTFRDYEDGLWKVAFVELSNPPRSQNIYKVQLARSCRAWFDIPGFWIRQFINEEELILVENDCNDYDDETDTETVRIVILNVRTQEFKKKTLPGNPGVWGICFLGDTETFWMWDYNAKEMKMFLTLVVNGKIVKTIEGEEVSWFPESPK